MMVAVAATVLGAGLGATAPFARSGSMAPNLPVPPTFGFIRLPLLLSWRSACCRPRLCRAALVAAPRRAAGQPVS